MNATLFSIIVLAVYFIYIGWRRRVAALAEEVPTERHRHPGFFEVVASIFTVVGAGEYALAITLVGIYGFAGPSLFVGLALALFLIALVARRVRQVAFSSAAPTTSCDGYQNFTTPDLFYVRFGRVCSFVSTVITVLAFTGILWLQFILGGELIAGLAGVDYRVAVALLAVVVALYVALGRFPAIFHTDKYQGVFMWATLYLTVAFVFVIQPDAPSLSSTLSTIGDASRQGLGNLAEDPTVITILLITVIAAFAGPDLWQRVTMAPSDAEAVRGSNLAGVMMLVFLLPLVLLAVDVFAVVPAGTVEPFVTYAASLGAQGGHLPVWIQIPFALGLLSAFLSTADTSAMLVATAVLNEWKRERVATNRHLPIRHLQFIVFVVVGIGVIAAVFAKEASLLFTGVLSILAAQGLPFLFAIFGRGTRVLCGLALVVGSAVALALTFLLPDYNTGYWLLLPLVPGLLCAVGRAKAST